MIRDFVKMAFAEAGVELGFEGSGVDEIAKVVTCNGVYKIPAGQVVLRVDPRYYRPTEVDLLIGDASKAKQKLGWEPQYTLAQMVKEMVDSDLKLFETNKFLKESGFNIKNEFE